MRADQQALILILAVCGFGSTFAGRITEPLVGVMARDLGTAPETIALLSTAYALPYAFIQPVLGPVGDALGKARIMKICLAVLSVTLLASAFTPSSPVLFTLRILSGAAAGGIVPLALAMIGDRVGMEGRQVAISRFLIAVILGQLAGSSAAGLIASEISWRGVFILAALIAVAGAAAALVRLKPAPGAARVFSLSVALERYRDLLLNPRARALFALVFVEATAIFGVFPYVAVLLESRGEGGPREAGLALGGFALGGLAYTALVGVMLRRLGVPKILIGGGVASAGALSALTLGGDWIFDAVALGLLGLGFYMLHNSFQTQVTEVAPTARASAVALHAFSFFVGQALGVVLVGQGFGLVGVAPTLLACAAVILSVGLAAAAVLGPATKR
ncbi:MAG TPA: MFS transporter [Beijerinckiaceae bacterium]|jgi:predicted MFS family arabinose efflux permease